MIPFLTAVNITDGTADFDAEGAAFANGLTSRSFRGRACVSKQDPDHIQYKAPSAHFWAEGQIDAPVNTVFKLRMKVTGSGNGWYVVQGVEYPGDGKWYPFVMRAARSEVGFIVEAVSEDAAKKERAVGADATKSERKPVVAV